MRTSFDEQLRARQTILSFCRKCGVTSYTEIIRECARDCGSHRRAQSALKWLVEAGFLSKVKRGYMADGEGDILV